MWCVSALLSYFLSFRQPSPKCEVAEAFEKQQLEQDFCDVVIETSRLHPKFLQYRLRLAVVTVDDVFWTFDVITSEAPSFVESDHQPFQAILVQAKVTDIDHDGRHVFEENKESREYQHEARSHRGDECSILEMSKWSLRSSCRVRTYNWIDQCAKHDSKSVGSNGDQHEDWDDFEKSPWFGGLVSDEVHKCRVNNCEKRLEKIHSQQSFSKFSNVLTWIGVDVISAAR